eukprot:jgi/Picsp_1/6679/NSC_04022-R1_---NA---
MDSLSDDLLVKHVLPCLTFRDALLFSRTSKRYNSLVLISKELWKGYYYSTFSCCDARNGEENLALCQSTENEWLLACKEELARSKAYKVKLLAVQKLRTKQEIHAVERKIYFCSRDLEEEKERAERLQKSSKVLGEMVHDRVFAEAHRLWQPMAISSLKSHGEVCQVDLNLEEAKCYVDGDVKLSKLELKKLSNRLSFLQNRLNELKHRLQTLQG